MDKDDMNYLKEWMNATAKSMRELMYRLRCMIDKNEDPAEIKKLMSLYISLSAASLSLMKSDYEIDNIDTKLAEIEMSNILDGLEAVLFKKKKLELFGSN